MTYNIVFKFSVLAIPMGILYFFMMMYFYVFTMWYEGGKDIHRVKAGTVKYFPAKGFVSAGIVGAFASLAYFLPSFLTQGSLSHGIAYLGKLFFMLPSTFLSWPIVDKTLTDEQFAALKEALSGTLRTQISVVFFGMLIAWIVGAGIGYIVGYKQIKIFQPFLDKWKKD